MYFNILKVVSVTEANGLMITFGFKSVIILKKKVGRIVNFHL